MHTLKTNTFSSSSRVSRTYLDDNCSLFYYQENSSGFFGTKGCLNEGCSLSHFNQFRPDEPPFVEPLNFLCTQVLIEVYPENSEVGPLFSIFASDYVTPDCLLNLDARPHLDESSNLWPYDIVEVFIDELLDVFGKTNKADKSDPFPCFLNKSRHSNGFFEVQSPLYHVKSIKNKVFFLKPTPDLSSEHLDLEITLKVRDHLDESLESFIVSKLVPKSIKPDLHELSLGFNPLDKFLSSSDKLEDGVLSLQVYFCLL